MMDVEDMIFLGLDLYGGLASLATEFELGMPTVIRSAISPERVPDISQSAALK